MKVVMVTGGSGLVGGAIQEVIEAEAPADEKWVFLSSKVRGTPARASRVLVRVRVFAFRIARLLHKVPRPGCPKGQPARVAPVSKLYRCTRGRAVATSSTLPL